MEGHFADDYADSVASIYRLRSDFGVDLRLSMGGRSFMLAHILEAIALRLAPQALGSLFEAAPGEAPTRLFAYHDA